MQATVKNGSAGREANYGGLSGKARRRRNRSRAQRLYSKQFIDEYLEPKAPSHSDRYIPIRRRSEFLPSAPLPEGVAFVRKEAERELQLGLDNNVDRLVGARAHKRKASGVIRFGVRATRIVSRAADRVKEAGGTDTARDSSADVAPPFTPRGFAYGCLFGSAAAAAILLVVRVAV